MSEEAPSAHGQTHVERRIDLISTVLLAVATLATAWAGFQSARWHSEQAKDQAKATATRIEASRSSDVANREAQVDVALFVQWVDATLQEETALADFYESRFTDRFQPAFKSWIAEKPFTNPDAPPSPFDSPDYRLDATAKAHDLENEANAAAADAATAIEHADHYVLAVVLFAACLFFAGLSTRLRTPLGQAVTLGTGCMLFIGTTIWVITLPIASLGT